MDEHRLALEGKGRPRETADTCSGAFGIKPQGTLWGFWVCTSREEA